MLDSEQLKDYSIDFQVTKPNKDGDIWKVTAVVLVRYKERSKPASKFQIDFLKKGELQNTVLTDNDGQSVADIDFQEPGSYLVAARIRGTAIQITKQVTVERDPLKATRLVTHQFGPIGEYALTFQVLASDDRPVPNARITVENYFESDPAPKALELKETTLKTDEDGTARLLVSFSEQGGSSTRCFLTAMVPGIEYAEELILQGPLPERSV